MGRHRVVIGLHRIDRTILHSTEQIACGYKLVGIEQFNFHLAVGRLVEGIHGRLDDMRRKRRARVGLETPADRRPGMDCRRGKRHGAGPNRGGSTVLQEGTSGFRHVMLVIFALTVGFANAPWSVLRNPAKLPIREVRANRNRYSGFV